MGTWSDDSSLLLATKDGLSDGFSLSKVSQNFLKWYAEEDYTPHGKIFDMGITTRNSLERVVFILLQMMEIMMLKVCNIV